jgi:hypothetical protein
MPPGTPPPRRHEKKGRVSAATIKFRNAYQRTELRFGDLANEFHRCFALANPGVRHIKRACIDIIRSRFGSVKRDEARHMPVAIARILESCPDVVQTIMPGFVLPPPREHGRDLQESTVAAEDGQQEAGAAEGDQPAPVCGNEMEDDLPDWVETPFPDDPHAYSSALIFRLDY